MPEVSVSATIPAPADKIWAVITDFERFGEWNTIHTAFPNGGPVELAVGAVYGEKMTLMGMPAEVSWTVSEVAAPATLALDGKGPMGITLRQQYTLTGDGDGTKVTVDSEFKGAAVNMLAARVKEATSKALVESLEKLSGLVG
ncbi:type II toxin-antitoxin system Rv0910 family toxin [Streptacidiphilus neutrinimicus]|uniref:type II toxin-antitoxin system Rv0910 family toxin n=1 Tax=Streptacidiphilus neutrinimicus TaxID=105420 RepID=UPI0005A98AC7|nr:SRPBCC family protein [Streptacidiphilus neutrinimicus]